MLNKTGAVNYLKGKTFNSYVEAANAWISALKIYYGTIVPPSSNPNILDANITLVQSEFENTDNNLKDLLYTIITNCNTKIAITQLPAFTYNGTIPFFDTQFQSNLSRIKTSDKDQIDEIFNVIDTYVKTKQSTNVSSGVIVNWS